MFQKGEYVFYGAGGICKIFDVCKAPLEGMAADRDYYVMRSVHDPNGILCVPVDSESVYLRRVLTREQAMLLLDRIRDISPIESKNAKQLRTQYQECMQTHEPEAWVRIIKTVWERESGEEGRKLSDTERGFAESARRYLHTELSLALGVREEDMERYIAAHVEK